MELRDEASDSYACGLHRTFVAVSVALVSFVAFVIAAACHWWHHKGDWRPAAIAVLPTQHATMGDVGAAVVSQRHSAQLEAAQGLEAPLLSGSESAAAHSDVAAVAAAVPVEGPPASGGGNAKRVHFKDDGDGDASQTSAAAVAAAAVVAGSSSAIGGEGVGGGSGYGNPAPAPTPAPAPASSAAGAGTRTTSTERVASRLRRPSLLGASVATMMVHARLTHLGTRPRSVDSYRNLAAREMVVFLHHLRIIAMTALGLMLVAGLQGTLYAISPAAFQCRGPLYPTAAFVNSQPEAGLTSGLLLVQPCLLIGIWFMHALRHSKWQVVRKCVEAGCLLAVIAFAHHSASFATPPPWPSDGPQRCEQCPTCCAGNTRTSQ